MPFLHLLLPAIDGIPVLMYHHVRPGAPDGLSITPENLHAHLDLLKRKGYKPLSLQAFIDTALGARPRRRSDLLLTFDDGYRDNLDHAYPLLQKFGWPATIFVITGTLDGTFPLDEAGPDRKLSLEDYRSLDTATIQLALHGHHHENHKHLAPGEAGRIAERSIRAFKQAGLPFFPVLAYPYGGRPKDPALRKAMQADLAQAGISLAFRIGNKPQRMPVRNKYEIKRIDVLGSDDVARLAIKLRKGKLKPF